MCGPERGGEPQHRHHQAQPEGFRRAHDNARFERGKVSGREHRHRLQRGPVLQARSQLHVSAVSAHVRRRHGRSREPADVIELAAACSGAPVERYCSGAAFERLLEHLQQRHQIVGAAQLRQVDRSACERVVRAQAHRGLPQIGERQPGEDDDGRRREPEHLDPRTAAARTDADRSRMRFGSDDAHIRTPPRTESPDRAQPRTGAACRTPGCVPRCRTRRSDRTARRSARRPRVHSRARAGAGHPTACGRAGGSSRPGAGSRRQAAPARGGSHGSRAFPPRRSPPPPRRRRRTRRPRCG